MVAAWLIDARPKNSDVAKNVFIKKLHLPKVKISELIDTT